MLHRVCAFITACILGVTGWGGVRVYAGNGLSEGTARDAEKYYGSVKEDTGIERMSSKNGEEEKDPWVCVREDHYDSIRINKTNYYEYDEKGRCIYVHFKSMGIFSDDTYKVCSYSDKKESSRMYKYHDRTPYFSIEKGLDAEGKIVSESVSMNSQTTSRYQYSYKGDLLMSIKDVYIGDSTSPGVTAPGETRFTYKNGQLIQKQYFEAANLRDTTYYEYDLAGNLIDESQYNPDKTGELFNRTHYKYNEANQIIEMRTVPTGPESFRNTYYYTYDEYGNRIREYYKMDNGEKSLKTVYTYVRLSKALKMPRDPRPDHVV